MNCCIGNCDFGLDRTLISIGNDVVLQDGVKTINYQPTAEHFDKVLGQGQTPNLRDLASIKIEDHVFIAVGAVILPNVTIGKNSLVLEHSVVMESVPEGSVICGNPARVVDSIEHWYEFIRERNQTYPWYARELSHEQVVKERETYFFED